MTQNTQTIAVIIPCYNAADTLAEAVFSALRQNDVASIWIVNDASSDASEQVAEQLVKAFPEKINLLNMPKNSGAAMARNWAALHAKETLLAFLDADDVYEEHALSAAAAAFQFLPELAVVRLTLKPWGVPENFTTHPNFSRAWRSAEMTGAGNLVMLRSLFLAAGGFPNDDLFKKHGGEDAALGLALHDSVMVGTLFEHPGVMYRYREGSHCERLLNVHLFEKFPMNITAEDVAQADQVTAHIKNSLLSLRMTIRAEGGAVVPLHVQMSD